MPRGSFVSPLPLLPLNELGETFVNVDALVDATGLGVDPAEEGLPRFSRVPFDRHLPDPRDGSRFDFERQDRPVGIVENLDNRSDRGAKVAAFVVDLLQPLRNLGRASRGRRWAEPFGDPLAQRTGRQPELAAELHALHAMNGNQVVAQPDAFPFGECLDLDVLVSAKAEEVRDRLADFGHRQRFAGGRFDQRLHGRVLGFEPFDDDFSGDDLFADVRRYALSPAKQQ